MPGTKDVPATPRMTTQSLGEKKEDLCLFCSVWPHVFSFVRRVSVPANAGIQLLWHASMSTTTNVQPNSYRSIIFLVSEASLPYLSRVFGKTLSACAGDCPGIFVHIIYFHHAHAMKYNYLTVSLSFWLLVCLWQFQARCWDDNNTINSGKSKNWKRLRVNTMLARQYVINLSFVSCVGCPKDCCAYAGITQVLWQSSMHAAENDQRTKTWKLSIQLN